MAKGTGKFGLAARLQLAAAGHECIPGPAKGTLWRPLPGLGHRQLGRDKSQSAAAPIVSGVQ